MLSAASRFILIGALALSGEVWGQVVKPQVATAPASAPASIDRAAPTASLRAPPARPLVTPALPTGLRLSGVEYVSVTELALWLGCKGAWTDPRRTLVLSDKSNPANRAELTADSREAGVNGLRVFLGEKVILRDDRLYVSRADAERSLAPLLRPGLGVPLPNVPRIIVLDPGHGGDDPGAENKAIGLKEKVLTLDIALRLKKLLEAAGYKVVLTREGDVALAGNKAIDLALRPDLANRARADLFISIHFNAATKDTRGTEVFTYAPRAQHATDWWGQISHQDASLETAEQPVNRYDHWSSALAGALHRRMLQTLKTEDRGKKVAHWAVLKTLNCPGVLVEPAIITNDADARRVAVPAFRQQIAEALAAGLRDYTAIIDALRPNLSPTVPSTPPK